MNRTLLLTALAALCGCYGWDEAVKTCTAENGCLKPTGSAGGGNNARVSGPPTAVMATANIRSAQVQWTAPVDEGGSTLIRYTVTAAPGGRTATVDVPALTADVTGLDDDTSYTFTVTATNGVGPSMASPPSVAVKTFARPGAPAAPTAIAGNSAARIDWSAVTITGGSPITGYRVVSMPGALEAMTTGALDATVTGLTNGTAYTFTVAAVTAVGEGPPSVASNSVIPTAVPPPPTGVTAMPGNAQADVQWVAPVLSPDAGISAVTGYRVTSAPGGLMAMTSGATTATVLGLTNGTAYTFSVKALNTQGESLPSAPSSAVTPAAVPGVPTAVTATSGDGQATVTWTAPADNGGSAITGYTVTAAPGGLTATTMGPTMATVTGLTNGMSYTFTVKARNAVGEGLPSAPSNAVTPASVPGAPTGVTATPGNAQAMVMWAAPASNGGSAITGYRVVSTPGGLMANAGAAMTQATVTGLTNGTGYTFTVVATNAVGDSMASGMSNAVTPFTVPAMPAAVMATRGDTQATVQWTAPFNGGSAITGYTVTSMPDGRTAMVGGAATQATVTMLTNGTPYTFSVTATNAAGTGPVGVSNSVTPAAVPGAPTAVMATRGNGQAVVQWTPPASMGGSPITSYTVTSSPGGFMATVGVAMMQATVTGLTNGTSYTFTVVATNAVGNSLASAVSNAVVPGTAPGVPTAAIATGGNMQATVQWTAPASNGGYAITGYTVTSSPGGIMASTGGATSTTVTGLMNGTSYTFTVVATNVLGSGMPSAASNAVTPGTVPTAPLGVRAVAGSASATVAWRAPTSSGGSPITSYRVTSSPGGLIQTTTGATTATVTGLTNGTPYTFTVTATNATGTSAPSSASNPATPAAPCMATVTFAPSQLDAGTAPVAVVAGDFNADGLMDLATANQGANTVGVLRGLGAGAFAQPVQYAVGVQPFSVAVGDLNADGLLDLAAANNGATANSVSVLLGTGSGFAAATTHSTTAGRPGGVVIADLTGDGLLDLATNNTTTHNVSVLANTGAGFSAAVFYSTAATGNPRSIATGDFNGDGRADVAVANFLSNNVTVLLQTMGGMLTSAGNFAVGTSPFFVVAGQLDGAGGIDLATANSGSNNASVLPGDSMGMFPTNDLYGVGTGPRSVASGDLSGDGRADLAVANFTSSNVAVLRGIAGGMFAAAVTHVVGASPHGVVIADFNNDGKLDVATANSAAGTVTLLLANGCL